MVTELNAKMIEFDFRNGPLRRKYDGLKYALKKIEEIVYELSLLDTLSDDPAMKRMKIVAENPAELPMVNVDDIDAIRARYEETDKIREEVIKMSRDVQKMAKQAIFSVHREKIDDARSKCVASLALIQIIAVKIEKVCIVLPKLLRDRIFIRCLNPMIVFYFENLFSHLS